MTKTIMSIAAVAALTTSGAFAFDTNSTGGITDNQGTPATYQETIDQSGLISVGGLSGDALVYPAYNMKDSWGTEITVRNNIGNGVMAKAVLYAADDSREVLDFNIYLSANDACRFTIKDGKVVSTDDSIVVSENITDNTIHVFASEANPFDTSNANGGAGVTLPDAGYVIIYGMGESNVSAHGDAAKAQIFEDYRENLDTKRVNWNTGLNMTNGVYTGGNGTDAPGQSVIVAPSIAGSQNMYDVTNYALSGNVRVFNAEGTTRDLLLNAHAIQNFTSGKLIMLWSPGEYASLADRDMQENSGGLATYNTTGKVEADAAKFLNNHAFYTYSNKGATPNVDNKLLVTQILKKTLLELGNNDGYWGMRDCAEDDGATTGMTFQANGSVWDESENQPETTIGGGLIVSPANSGSVAGYCNELAEINRPEADTDFADKNGYINFTFGSNGVPAIVTQMSASKVGDDYKINWVDSVTYFQPNP